MEDKNQLKAIIAIRNYLNKDYSDEYIRANFSIAMDTLIENSFRIEETKPVVGVSQITQGSQSMSFKSGTEKWVVTADVAMLLPIPFIRMC